MARERLFNMRMSDDEWARLERLAAHYGLNAAGVIRMLLKREDDAVQGAAPAARSTKKGSKR